MQPQNKHISYILHFAVVLLYRILRWGCPHCCIIRILLAIVYRPIYIGPGRIVIYRTSPFLAPPGQTCIHTCTCYTTYVMRSCQTGRGPYSCHVAGVCPPVATSRPDPHTLQCCSPHLLNSLSLHNLSTPMGILNDTSVLVPN